MSCVSTGRTWCASSDCASEVELSYCFQVTLRNEKEFDTFHRQGARLGVKLGATGVGASPNVRPVPAAAKVMANSPLAHRPKSVRSFFFEAVVVRHDWDRNLRLAAAPTWFCRFRHV